MTVSFLELAVSRAPVWNRQDVRIEMSYKVLGTEDETEVNAITGVNITQYYSWNGYTLPLQSYEHRHIGGGVWEGRASYGQKTGQKSWTLDTTGGTQHVTTFRGNVHARYVDGADMEAWLDGLIPEPPKFDGVIGVTNESVEGCDIQAQNAQYSETWYFPPELITDEYLSSLIGMTPSVNNATWRNQAEGEMLFLGMTGGGNGIDYAELTFKFLVGTNVTAMKVGEYEFELDIESSAPHTKEGWQYYWVRYRNAEKDSRIIQIPDVIIWGDVYVKNDFTRLGIG